MVPKIYFELLQKEGWSLNEAGVNEIGLRRQSALKAIDLLRRANIAVLGGDVYRVINGKPTLTYDNWFCERENYNELKEFLVESWNIAEKYISNYKEPENTIILYSFVLSDD